LTPWSIQMTPMAATSPPPTIPAIRMSLLRKSRSPIPALI
jgi:hypothetical protein